MVIIINEKAMIQIPDWEEYFMKMVYLVASKSKDPRTKVGAVVVNDDRQVLATGYNGVCRGVLDPADFSTQMPDHVNIKLPYQLEGQFGGSLNYTSVEEIRERNISPEKYVWYEHAERNSIYQAARIGVSLMGATMYTQGVPCCDCGRGVIQAGIKRVVVHKLWPRNGLEKSEKQDAWTKSIAASRKMFLEAGIEVDIVNKFLNVEGYLDGKVVKV